MINKKPENLAAHLWSAIKYEIDSEVVELWSQLDRQIYDQFYHDILGKIDHYLYDQLRDRLLKQLKKDLNK